MSATRNSKILLLALLGVVAAPAGWPVFASATEGLAERVDLLVDNVHLHLEWVVFGEHFRSDG